MLTRDIFLTPLPPY